MGIAGIALNVSLRNSHRGFSGRVSPDPPNGAQIKKGDYTYTYDSKKYGWKVSLTSLHI